MGHSLLFQNKKEEALAVYEEIKGLKSSDGRLYAAVLLEDLDALEEASITHPDVAEIRKWLKQ